VAKVERGDVAVVVGDLTIAGDSNPSSTEQQFDLPEPLAPTMATNSPGSMARSMSSRTTGPPG
jgi:hypothetical protein